MKLPQEPQPEAPTDAWVNYAAELEAMACFAPWPMIQGAIKNKAARALRFAELAEGKNSFLKGEIYTDLRFGRIQ